MKYFLLAGACFLFSLADLQAQTKLPELDKSPMDISYFPDRYPILKIQDKTTEPPLARVIYSRPQKKGRVIFGELLDYGKVWRMGANEVTEIEFFREAQIGDSKIKKGRYSLCGIPGPENWTIIINKETDTWGSFRYEEKNDLVRIIIPVQKQKEPVEDFSMVFEKTEKGADLVIAWDDIKLNLPLAF